MSGRVHSHIHTQILSMRALAFYSALAWEATTAWPYCRCALSGFTPGVQTQSDGHRTPSLAVGAKTVRKCAGPQPVLTHDKLLDIGRCRRLAREGGGGLVGQDPVECRRVHLEQRGNDAHGLTLGEEGGNAHVDGRVKRWK